MTTLLKRVRQAARFVRDYGAGMATTSFKRNDGHGRWRDAKREMLRSYLTFAKGDGDTIAPLKMFLELSNVCDMKCAMCGEFSHLNANRFKSLKKMDRGFLDVMGSGDSLDGLLRHTLAVHAFGYGEPTVHPQFKEVLEYLGEYEVMTDFITNGMHLTDDLCELMVQTRVWKIFVSFSGATKEDYENVYQGGKFDQVLAGIRRLRDARDAAGARYPLITANTIAFKHHLEKFPEFVALMADAGVDSIILKPLILNHGVTQLHGHAAILRPDIEGKLLEEGKRVAKERGVKIEAQQFERLIAGTPEEEEEARKKVSVHGKGFDDPERIIPIEELPGIAKKTTVIKPEPGSELKLRHDDVGPDAKPEDYYEFDRFAGTDKEPCSEPWRTLYVRRNGETYPCCYRVEQSQHFGNVHQVDAADIWRGGLAKAVRERSAQGEYPKDMCGRCIARSAYPKGAWLKAYAAAYGRWYLDRFSLDFDAPLIAQAGLAPDNRGVVKNWSAESKD